MHFGEADLGLRVGDAGVTAQRQFQPASQREAVDGGNDRLAGTFDPVDDFIEARFRDRLAEFGDIRTGYKGPAAPGEHGTDHAAIGLQRVDGGDQADPNGVAQRIDGRIVDGDEQHIVLRLPADRVGIGGCAGILRGDVLRHGVGFPLIKNSMVKCTFYPRRVKKPSPAACRTLISAPLP